MTSAAARAWLPHGTVYGTLLNFRREFAHWAPNMADVPYKGAPKAPVLYVKTANAFAPNGAAVPVGGEVWAGATLGLVMGAEWADSEQKSAFVGINKGKLAINSEANDLPGVAALVLLNDLSLPHESYYRPAIRYRNRDRFLVCGPACTAAADVVDLRGLKIELRINGALRQTVDLSTLVRDAAALLRDVGEFMTLQAGDVLMLGTDCLEGGERPLARAGDRVEISAPGFARLTHSLADERRLPDGEGGGPYPHPLPEGKGVSLGRSRQLQMDTPQAGAA